MVKIAIFKELPPHLDKYYGNGPHTLKIYRCPDCKSERGVYEPPFLSAHPCAKGCGNMVELELDKERKRQWLLGMPKEEEVTRSWKNPATWFK